MSFYLIAAFILGYCLIAFEQRTQVDKAASALLTGVICWTILVFGLDTMPVAATWNGATIDSAHFLNESFSEQLSGIAGILFFLLGAMTIVELVDAHDGFEVITDRITTTNRVKLLWILCLVAFFLSAVLDNLTTAIVMCTLARKLMRKEEDLWLFGGFIVIAANAGGAWSPIGDVTTIMLWIGGRVSSWNIITILIVPSLICLLVPLTLASFRFKGAVEKPEKDLKDPESPGASRTQQVWILSLGMASLLFVPIFKNMTHLPPFMGVLLGVGVLWFVTELVHRAEGDEIRSKLTVAGVLRRIDSPSILFFLGILLAVAALETSGHLHDLSLWLDKTFEGNIYGINILIGLLSAVVDNVPLVAAAMGMYDLNMYPIDHKFWELLAYCAGTGGSILIIGSAAGVAAMGVLRIDFIWYLKKMSWYALLGYLAGVGSYYILLG